MKSGFLCELGANVWKRINIGPYLFDSKEYIIIGVVIPVFAWILTDIFHKFPLLELNLGMCLKL